jgi:hypothetical protein
MLQRIKEPVQWGAEMGVVIRRVIRRRVIMTMLKWEAFKKSLGLWRLF